MHTAPRVPFPSSPAGTLVDVGHRCIALVDVEVGVVSACLRCNLSREELFTESLLAPLVLLVPVRAVVCCFLQAAWALMGTITVSETSK
jgi:hypothetical protein